MCGNTVEFPQFELFLAKLVFKFTDRLVGAAGDGVASRTASLASCVTAASSFEIFLRLPFSVMTTDFAMAFMKMVAKFFVPLRRPSGLPETPFLKRYSAGGRP